MKTKLFVNTFVLAAVGAGLSLPVVAGDELAISGNVSLASEYVFRGQSQTQENAAVQGGLDLEYCGFYVGAWGSNVDFNSDATAEIDYYGGYVFGLTEDLRPSSIKIFTLPPSDIGGSLRWPGYF